VDCARFDVVMEPVQKLTESAHRRRLVVFDRDGLDSAVPQAAPPSGPDPRKLNYLVEEFFRQLAIFPAAVLARRDWLSGLEGVHNARLMLYQLFTEANQPLPPMGVKQWSVKLTEAQRTVLTSLPAAEPTRDAVVAAMRATRDAFCTAGRAALVAGGGIWPQEVETAVNDYARRTLVDRDEGGEQ
jgi:hypothetical protein